MEALAGSAIHRTIAGKKILFTTASLIFRAENKKPAVAGGLPRLMRGLLELEPRSKTNDARTLQLRDVVVCGIGGVCTDIQLCDAIEHCVLVGTLNASIETLRPTLFRPESLASRRSRFVTSAAVSSKSRHEDVLRLPSFSSGNGCSTGSDIPAGR